MNTMRFVKPALGSDRPQNPGSRKELLHVKNAYRQSQSVVYPSTYFGRNVRKTNLDQQDHISLHKTLRLPTLRNS